jgi:predicted RNase H-like HicB family nuclease
MNDYAIVVYWSDEDGVCIAEAPDLKPCAAHGATPEKAVAELRSVMESWIDVARVSGLPLPPARFRAPADAAE